MKSGELERLIWRVKGGKWAWGYVFARVVLGFLYDNPSLVHGVDAIIPMPAFLPGGVDPRTDHARWVVCQAIEQDDRGLPFAMEPPLIVKTMATDRMRAASNARERRAIADQIYEALVVPDVDRVVGQRIMVYDDVFTSGNTLNAVARKLKNEGAVRVYGLALARQPWSS